MVDFHRIDDGLFAADHQVSTADLQDLYGDSLAAREARTRCATITYDRANAPRICCAHWAVKNAIPFRLTPGTKELKIKLLNGGAKGHASPTVGLRVWLRPWGVQTALTDDPLASGTVAAIVENMNTLTLDAAALRGYSGLVQILIGFESNAGTAVKLTDKATGLDDDIIQNYGKSYVDFNTEPGSPWAEGVPCANIQFRSYDTSGPTAEEFNARLPQLRQLIRAWSSTNRFRGYLYPPLSDETISPPSGTERDIIYYEPLSYIDLYAIQIIETSIETGPSDNNGAYNVNRAPSVLPVRQIQLETERVFGWHTRVHAVGGQPDLELSAVQRDTSNPGLDWHGDGAIVAGGAPINPFSKYAVLDTNKNNLASCLVNDQAKYHDEVDATDKQHTRLEVASILLVSSKEAGEYEVQHDLHIATAVTDAGAATVDEETIDATAAVFDRGQPHDDPVGYLADFYDQDYNQQYSATSKVSLRIHALRGLWPVSIWHQAPWVYLRREIKDAAASLSAGARRLTLRTQGQIAAVEGGVPYQNSAGRHVHFIGWCVTGATGLDGTELGES